MHIHHQRFGEGHPIVLVHGWGVDAQRCWIETGWVAALQAVRQVVAIDCRGHGYSEKPHAQDAYSYRAMSQDVLQVMDELGIGTADLFGYSMGAFMAISLLGHHRDRFSSVIMGGIGDETQQSQSVRFVIADALRAVHPERIADSRGRAYRAFVDADPNNDLVALSVAALQMWPEGHPLDLGGTGLSEVDIPVLIVNGTHDHPYVDTAERLAAAIPRAKAVTLSGSDHLSAISDRRFKEVVLDFLNRGG